MRNTETKPTFDAVIFDLGSTLIYFDAEWPRVVEEEHQALVQHLVQSGYQIDEDRFVTDFINRLDAYYIERDTEFIELSTEYILRTVLEEHGYADIPSTDLRPALDAMYAVSQAHWQAEEETHITLQTLRDQGYRLGLISNAKDAVDVRKLIENWKLGDYFEVTLISADIGIRKPHPRIFEMALKEMGVSPDRAVMVGDTLGADILGAHNVGMASVWITRRAATPDNRDHLDTIQPDGIIKSLRELPELLARWSEMKTNDSRADNEQNSKHQE